MTALADLPCACATARQAARVITQHYNTHLSDSGMEAPQFTLLMTLEQRGACSQAELGRRYALDKTTVSRNLKLLERHGWIACSVPGDKRQRHFALTALGRRKLAKAKPQWKKAQAGLRAAMTGEQWDAMFQAFRTVSQTAAKIAASGLP